VVEEGRAEARAATQERLRTVTTAATAAARSVAMPGELEDLGGAPAPPPPPPIADVEAVRADATARKAELMRSVDAARRAAIAAEHAGDRPGTERERSDMHRLLADLATLDQQLAALDAAAVAARAAAATGSTAPLPPPRPRPTVDPLTDLKSKVAAQSRSTSASLDDELAALKRRMSDDKKRS
jgi:hypothetical protein